MQTAQIIQVVLNYDRSYKFQLFYWVTPSWKNITFLKKNIVMIVIMTKVWNNCLPLFRSGQKLIVDWNL